MKSRKFENIIIASILMFSFMACRESKAFSLSDKNDDKISSETSKTIFLGNYPQKTKQTDYEKIVSLVNWERQARTRHLPDLKDCYFEDATVTTSWTRGPASNYLNGNEGSVIDAEHPVINRTGNAIVHLNRKRAYVELPSTTTRWMDVNGKVAVLESYMRLIYSVEKRRGEWKIVDMCSINEGDTLTPAVIGDDLKINPDDLKQFRHSYRYLAYIRSLRGIKMSDDEFGIDRPEDVNKLYQEKEKWIK